MMFRLVMRRVCCNSRSGRRCQRFWNEEFRIVNVVIGERAIDRVRLLEFQASLGQKGEAIEKTLLNLPHGNGIKERLQTSSNRNRSAMIRIDNQSIGYSS